MAKKIVVELNRAESYEIVAAFRQCKRSNRAGNMAFVKVEDAICKYDKEVREAKERKIVNGK